MLFLLISLAALIVGPWLQVLVNDRRYAVSALDGFVMVAVGGLVIVHILPHGLVSAGPWALLVAGLGFLGPSFVERTLHRAAAKAHQITLALAIAGLGIHTFIDGIALGVPAGHEHEGVSALALAVSFHRLPIAITVWSLLRPTSGLRYSVGVLVALGASTVAGFALAHGLDDGSVSEHGGLLADSTWLGLLQALMGGTLLHVVIHRPSARELGDKRERFAAGLGAVGAIVMLALLSEEHLIEGPHGTTLYGTFYALLVETAPALLLAFAMAGLVQVCLPQASLAWIRTGRPVTEAARGVLFGLPLPICSCGVVPLYRSLITRGVPAAAAMAFLVATPELGLDAVLISLPLLGGEFTLMRVAAAFVVALFVGWLIGGRIRRQQPHEHSESDAPASRDGLIRRVRQGLQFGFGEVVDHIGPWILLGLAVAAIAEPVLRGDWILALPWGVDVFVFAVLGMPSYVCASAATPLAAILIAKGVSPGAALAFLITGPATNITTFGVLRQLHGARVAAAFGGTIAALSIVLGVVVNGVLGDHHVPFSIHGSHGASGLERMALVALALVFLLSVLRQGPRLFLGQILSPYGHDGHDHGHSHGSETDAEHTQSCC